MAQNRTNDMDGNQGEGNRAAAEQYNDGVRNSCAGQNEIPAA